MFNQILDKALPEINSHLPLDSFAEITSVRPGKNTDSHSVVLEGVDADGCRVTETYWIGCRDSDCPLENVIKLKVLPDGLLEVINKCGNELTSLQTETIVYHLNKLEDLTKKISNDYVGGVYSYNDENVGDKPWRKFLVTEVTNPVFPMRLRGVSMDDDGECRELEISQLDLFERVADCSFLD